MVMDRCAPYVCVRVCVCVCTLRYVIYVILWTIVAHEAPLIWCKQDDLSCNSSNTSFGYHRADYSGNGGSRCVASIVAIPCHPS